MRWVRLATNIIRYMDMTESKASEAWALKYMEGVVGREELEKRLGADKLKALEAFAADADADEAAASAVMEDEDEGYWSSGDEDM